MAYRVEGLAVGKDKEGRQQAVKIMLITPQEPTANLEAEIKASTTAQYRVRFGMESEWPQPTSKVIEIPD